MVLKKPFAPFLIEWFEEHGRHLPWRVEYTSYRVWIAELMLCQTRVSRVIPRYLEWMERFPNLFSLTRAPLEELLFLWRGLGYYARPHHIHRTAHLLVEKFQGEFPQDYQTLVTLPGIGQYVAGAILAIAYNLPYPAIDGNVKRVFARLYDLSFPLEKGKGQKFLFRLVSSRLLQENARSFTQGLMDLGAMVCTPRQPNCGQCPLKQWCLACAQGTQEYRPVRISYNRRETEITMFLIHHQGMILIRQRLKERFLPNLWEIPWQESGSPETLYETVKEFTGELTEVQKIGEFSHHYCNRLATVHLYWGNAKTIRPTDSSPYRWETIAALKNRPFSSLHEKALRMGEHFFFSQFDGGNRGNMGGLSIMENGEGQELPQGESRAEGIFLHFPR